MKVLFVHISSDPVILADDKETHILPFRDLERVFPQTLVMLCKKTPYDLIVVINGPGSFTSLRIGCVALNMLQMLSVSPYTFVSRTKPDLYGLLVKKWFLPSFGIVTIGQQKKLRGVDYDTQAIQYLTESTLPTLPETYFVESLETHILAWQLHHAFFVSYQRQPDWLHCVYNNKKDYIPLSMLLDDSKKTTYLVPQYMIEPQIG